MKIQKKLDPVRYEMFRHRLYNILEEGRIALQRVCASPIVVQGGECMSAFYNTEGVTIVSASGHLRFCAGCSDAVKKCIEWFEEDPGIFEGDQFFFNDPYIASTHVYDQMIVRPIFHRGKRIAWTASMTHTADTGGLLRGGTTEIFHEGIRILGLKLVEKGKFRPDVFKTLTEQCRDPHYVGLDLKSRIASNNVCSKGFMELVEKYGVDFVQAASKRMIEDAEKKARAKLRSLPDGTWRSRIYHTGRVKKTGAARVFKVVCKMTKKKDEIIFDCTGTSSQNEDEHNATRAASWGTLYISLASHLFWDIPWNGGMEAPVKLIIPEGTVLNCKFPAACGGGPSTGLLLTNVASDCIAKMLYAAGVYEDVNAAFSAYGSEGGPGFFYGGHNQYGIPVGQGIYDTHASGFGATPTRDGVSTGGHQNNPTIGISDIENTEMNYPFIYLGRRHTRDGGGFGKYAGGMGIERLLMVRGSKDININWKAYDGIPGGWGLFGGYPVGAIGERIIFKPREMEEKIKNSTYPNSTDECDSSWGEIMIPKHSSFQRIQLSENDILAEPLRVGSGYGDPLDRAPKMVADDVRDQAVSRAIAKRIYGVIFKDGSLEVDQPATESERVEIRAERIRNSTPPEKLGAKNGGGKRLLKVHEYLEVIKSNGKKIIQCVKCHFEFCGVDDNYKKYAQYRKRDLLEVRGKPMLTGDSPMVVYQEYICPGCATLLQVDILCPELDSEEPLWDMQVKV